MDSVLANSQANLAHKQRELANLTQFQLPPNPHLNLGEKQHLHEAEELFKLTRDLKNDLDNRVPLSDPIAQIQQKKIQLLIAERQYTVAESQIRIIQGHILSEMDNRVERSALSRSSDMKTTDQLQKQAQPLLNEASELLKKGRHSVTFAELGARQRMGSLAMQQQQQQQKQYRDSQYAREADETHLQETFSDPQPEPQPQYGHQGQEAYQQQNQDQRHDLHHGGVNGPVAKAVEHYREEVPPPGSPVMEERQIAYPSERSGMQSPILEKRQEPKGGCSRCCCIGFIVFLVLCLIVGGTIYALIAYGIINF